MYQVISVLVLTPILKWQRRKAHRNNRMQRLRAEILRQERASISPADRIPYAPAQQSEIIELMRLRGWSVEQTARRFVIPEEMLRQWLHQRES